MAVVAVLLLVLFLIIGLALLLFFLLRRPSRVVTLKGRSELSFPRPRPFPPRNAVAVENPPAKKSLHILSRIEAGAVQRQKLLRNKAPASSELSGNPFLRRRQRPTSFRRREVSEEVPSGNPSPIPPLLPETIAMPAVPVEVALPPSKVPPVEVALPPSKVPPVEVALPPSKIIPTEVTFAPPVPAAKVPPVSVPPPEEKLLFSLPSRATPKRDKDPLKEKDFFLPGVGNWDDLMMGTRWSPLKPGLKRPDLRETVSSRRERSVERVDTAPTGDDRSDRASSERWRKEEKRESHPREKSKEETKGVDFRWEELRRLEIKEPRREEGKEKPLRTDDRGEKPLRTDDRGENKEEEHREERRKNEPTPETDSDSREATGESRFDFESDVTESEERGGSEDRPQPREKKVKIEEQEAIDVVGYSNRTLKLLPGGREVAVTSRERDYSATCTPPMERLESFRGYIFGLSRGGLFVLDQATLSSPRWLFKPCDWAPVGIVSLSATYDTSFLWVQTRETGYLFDEEQEEVLRVPVKGKTRRVYGRTREHYAEIEEERRFAVVYPGEEVINDVDDVLLDPHGRPLTSRRRDRRLRLVHWRPVSVKRDEKR